MQTPLDAATTTMMGRYSFISEEKRRAYVDHLRPSRRACEADELAPEGHILPSSKTIAGVRVREPVFAVTAPCSSTFLCKRPAIGHVSVKDTPQFS
ncbi:hypothetical protein [Rhizobium sp. A37_96]